MNLAHRWLCQSRLWRRTVKTKILPWVLSGIDLNGHVLEVGPGPGHTTELLRASVGHLTCIERDHGCAIRLARRLAGRNVTVINADATSIPLADATCDGAVMFTVLHHIASEALQNKLLEETARVLRPGGVFAGSDTLYSPVLSVLHWFDTLVPVQPDGFAQRLAGAGFEKIQIEVRKREFKFTARRRRLLPASIGKPKLASTI